MTIALTVGGTTYSYPEEGDTLWGTDATSWAQAVTVEVNKSLTTDGGTFVIASTVDFGGTAGIKALSFSDRSASPASTGNFRLGSSGSLAWRNNADDGDLPLAINGSDELTFNGSTVSTSTNINIVDDTTPQLGGDLDVNGQSIVSVSDGNIPITPDGTGSIILDGLNWPQVDGAEFEVLQTDGAGNLSFAVPREARNLGQDVYNATGVTLTKGSVVYETGFDAGSGLITVDDALADSETTMPAIGILKEDIANGASGTVIIAGLVSDLDTSSFTEGDPIYVSATVAGEVTSTKPTTNPSDEIQRIGVCVVADASIGSILVSGAGRTNDTPNELDHDLYVDGFGIKSDGANELTLESEGSGDAALRASGSGDVVIENTGSGDITLGGLIYPQADGTINEVLTTDGAGNLSFSGVTITEGIENQSGAPITIGQVVYETGYNDPNIQVDLADASSSASMPGLSIVSDASIANGGVGQSVTQGELSGVDTSSFSVGDTLYVSTTAGVLTNVPPTSAPTDIIQGVAVVLEVGVSGTILVGIQGEALMPNQMSWDLDVNGFSLTSSSNGDIALTPDGAGQVLLGNRTVFDGGPEIDSVQIDPKGALIDNTTGSLLLRQISNDVFTIRQNGDADLQIIQNSGNLSDSLKISAFNGNTVDILTENFGSGAADISVTSSQAVDIDATTDVEIDATNDVIIQGLSYPAADGTANQAITTDGLGTLSFADVLQNLVEDTTPQLGGDLDTNGFNITGAGGSLNLDDGGDILLDAGANDTVQIQGFTANLVCDQINGAVNIANNQTGNNDVNITAYRDVNIESTTSGDVVIEASGGTVNIKQTVKDFGTSTPYTVLASDVGKMLTTGKNGADMVVNINTGLGLVAGESIDFIQLGSSTIQFGGTATINSAGGLTDTANQYSAVTVYCVGTDDYILIGDLA